MDVIAHGLWGAGFFGRKNRMQWRVAALLGMAPDVLAFGPFLITQIGSSNWITFPRYVYQSYDVTHSLVVWAALTGLVWLVRRSFPWVMCAWALHILCDIPFHSTDFFPTPYLWPLATPLHNGMPWARPTFLIVNYVAILGLYATLGLLRRKNHTTAAILILLASATLHAEDWPQFRGPGGEGHSTERALPAQWSETQNVLWKTPVAGRGWSSPVIAGGRVWLTTSIDRNDDASLRLLAFDIATGKEVVNAEVLSLRDSNLKNEKNSHASPTPIVEGNFVYVHFGATGTAALSTEGRMVWKRTLPYDSQHGNGGSPTLYRDLIIINCDGSDDAYVIALDKNTGKTRWKTQRRLPYDQSYSTPLVIEVNGHDQLISVGAHRTMAYDPLSGKEIWRVSYGDGFSNVPRPVYSHGLVFIGTGFQEASMMAVRPTGTGDVTNTHVAYTIERGAPFTPSPIVVGDEFYMVSDIGIASCLDVATGKTIWQARMPGNYSASPVFADGKIYFLSEEGVATVIALGKEFKKLAENHIDGATFASIGVSQGSLFLRSDTHLYRIGSR